MRCILFVCGILAVAACGREKGVSGTGGPGVVLGVSDGGDAGFDLGRIAGADGGADAGADAGWNVPMADAGSGGADAGPEVPLAGVWQVTGSDGLGNYAGQVELVPDADAGGYGYTRVVQYLGATVEDGGALWWVWQGVASAAGQNVAVNIPLQIADFISQRGTLSRTTADQVPVQVVGTLTRGPGTVSGSYGGPHLAATETWTAWAHSGATPIFALDEHLQQLNGPIDPTTKAALWATYASFFALPAVAPYVNTPAFQAGIHSELIDRTDYDFYQANPGAIRVVNKVVDPISTEETALRAQAFKWSLVGKAAFIDEDLVLNFVDPVTGLVDDENRSPIEDGSLWSGCYVASQALRYGATGDPTALTNIETTMASLATLVEITGDPTQFARELRPTDPSNETGGWIAGTGQFAGIDWLTGGNNDCFKGVILGLATGYGTLCDPVLPGQQVLCQRVQADVKSLADKLALAQPHGGDRLLAQWLADDVVGGLTYDLNLAEEWNLQASDVQNAGFQKVDIITADWSGTNLTCLEYICMYLLSQKASIPGTNAQGLIVQGIDTMQSNFHQFRLGLWSVLFATLSHAPLASSADDARWRLRELSAPKPTAVIDHRVNAGFTMSPFPTAPWKNDWTTSDRTQSLVGYPMFEINIEDYAWKDSALAYSQNTSGGRQPEADYLLAYWLGRSLGLFSPTE